MMRYFAPILVMLAVAPMSVLGQEPGGKYAAAVGELRGWIEKEVALKDIPALSIAIVDDQETVWAAGFGHTDELKKTLAGPGTVYRIGSVSKPIAALLLMLYVEQGKIDLDAPVRDYLPDFRPKNPSGKKITLRQALSHRSGLVRESPVGGYFDATKPSLADTVKSLNDTELVYEPETMTSYSNLGPCLSGVILEGIEKKPYPAIMKEKLFDPLGMADSAVELTDALRLKLPRALMTTYHGRNFPAPVFDLATTPAGNIYSTALDQAKLLSCLFARGKTAKGQMIKGESLEQMWTPQFAKKGDKVGFGLGFFVSEFEGQRRVEHGGAVYGFATEFEALPDAKLGVVVMAARDVANGLTRHIAEVSLRHMLAAQAGKPLPKIEVSEPVGAAVAKAVAGVYRNGSKKVELETRDGRLWIWPPRAAMRLEVRKLGSNYILDDAFAFGVPFTIKDQTVTWNKIEYTREPTPEPRPIPVHWESLIGEYGPDHNRLTILEKDGLLQVLIEWAFLYPLREISENVFAFPDYGMYHGHTITFQRDKTGHATAATAAHYRFERLPLPRAGETFKLTPVRPIAELRKIALAAEPPKESNALLRAADLVEVTKLDPALRLDLRYATANNFLGELLYTAARAYLQRPAAEALVRVNKKLEPLGYGLLIHDAYRPWHVTKIFHDATPPRFHHFVADPAIGSRHNRGCAVDLTLYDRVTGKAVEMVSGYDEFSDRSYPDYVGGTAQQRARRGLLRQAMEAEGFTVFAAEWWHFDFNEWRSYPILNETFEQLAAQEESQDAKAIRGVLDEQAAAWNANDLPRFMKGYWESDQLSFFSGNAKTLGWKATLERYQKKYQGEGKEMGRLSFDELSVEILGADHALVRGRFRLELRGESPTGIFTLVFRRTPSGWRIIHDHTSS